MSGNEPGRSTGQNVVFKIATALALILLFGLIFIIQKEMSATGEWDRPFVTPVQEVPIAVKAPPPPAEPEPAAPQPAPVVQPKIEAPEPAIVRQPVLPSLPKAPVRPSAPPPSPGLAPGVQMLPAPVTEVHPLSDAEEVMGAPSSEVGEIGVTKTFKLPDDAGQNETYPPPNE